MIISIDKAQKFYDKIKNSMQNCSPIGSISFKIDPAYSSEEILEKAGKKIKDINQANNLYFILQEECLKLKSIIFKSNIEVGLHDKINELYLLKNKRNNFKNMMKKEIELFDNVTKEFIDRKIQLITDAPNLSSENFSVLVTDNSILESEIKAIDKKIVILEDEIKELNYSTKIEIDLKPETIEYLDL